MPIRLEGISSGSDLSTLAFGAFLFFLLATLLVGCVEGPPSSPSSNWVDGAVLVDEATLKVLDDGVRGSGRIKMKSILMGVDSREHYILEFRPLDKVFWLRLHSHFSGFQDRDGTEIHFSYHDSVQEIRSGPVASDEAAAALELNNSDRDIQIFASTPGFPRQKIGSLGEIPIGAIVRLRLEVHDGVIEGVHIFVWQDQISLQGEVLRRLDIVAPGGTFGVVNTRDDQRVFFSHGRGLFWGLEFNQVEVRDFQREAPYVN